MPRDRADRYANAALASGGVGVGGAVAYGLSRMKRDNERARAAWADRTAKRTAAGERRVKSGGLMQDRAGNALQSAGPRRNSLAYGSYVKSRRSWVKEGDKRISAATARGINADYDSAVKRRAAGERISRLGAADLRERAWLQGEKSRATASALRAGRRGRAGLAIAAAGGAGMVGLGLAAERAKTRRRSTPLRPVRPNVIDMARYKDAKAGMTRRELTGDERRKEIARLRPKSAPEGGRTYVQGDDLKYRRAATGRQAIYDQWANGGTA